MKYYEVEFNITPCSDIASDILTALAGECGFEAFENTEEGVKGWVRQQQYRQSDIDTMIATFPLQGIRITYTVIPAAYENWNAQWEEESFRPIILTDPHDEDKSLVCIHDTRHMDVPQAPYDILIDPCQAFGTGTHQTTRMILRRLLDMELRGKNVIDAGTGTGILSIMCSLLGASQVLAYDIDEWSVRNAQANLRLNKIENVRVRQGDSTVLVASDRASAEDVAMHQPVDLLIANINLNILLADMPRFASIVRSGGHMLLSGFYDTDAASLLDKARQFGFVLDTRHVDSEWAMLQLRKNR